MRRTVLTVCLATALPLAACGQDDTVAVSAGDLNGRTFLSTEIMGHDLVAGTRVQISFHDDQLSASAGCNTLGGAFTVEDGGLTLSSELFSTAMGCEDDLATQDEWLAGFLTDGPQVELNGDSLSLTGGEVTMEMLDETAADPARPLTGTEWIVESIIDAESASSVPSGVDPPTLLITDEGDAPVFTGCNRGGATVAIADSSLIFGPMRLTKMACGSDAASVEASVVAVLDGEVRYAIEGSQLSLSNADHGLDYRAP
jgi:heat shock protein HslJ